MKSIKTRIETRIYLDEVSTGQLSRRMKSIKTRIETAILKFATLQSSKSEDEIH